ncbi:MAG: 6,7-dimethyl-8-ribityllumazine synthase [marine bacterium B5-7]|nr:MAG: 6,7-dimethyl-8-ribityllumazine synthase [marine bacterium B5-7]
MQVIKGQAVNWATIAIVVSEFNTEITSALLAGAMSQLQESGVNPEKITVVHVPGAVEIPLTVSRLADTEKYDAIIALGAVIRGETSHYDTVCEQVSLGCQQVMLDYSLPVIFGVLTTENVEQARDRIGGKKGHKGKDVANAALAMISILQQIT